MRKLLSLALLGSLLGLSACNDSTSSSVERDSKLVGIWKGTVTVSSRKLARAAASSSATMYMQFKDDGVLYEEFVISSVAQRDTASWQTSAGSIYLTPSDGTKDTADYTVTDSTLSAGGTNFTKQSITALP